MQSTAQNNICSLRPPDRLHADAEELRDLGQRAQLIVPHPLHRSLLDQRQSRGSHTKVASVWRNGLVGTGVEVRRRDDARTAVRGSVLLDLPGEALLATEELGCATGRTTRGPKGCSRNSAQDRSPDADDMEIWRGLLLDKGGHCLI